MSHVSAGSPPDRGLSSGEMRADIVTRDGSLVRRFRIYRHTSQMRDVE